MFAVFVALQESYEPIFKSPRKPRQQRPSTTYHCVIFYMTEMQIGRDHKASGEISFCKVPLHFPPLPHLPSPTSENSGKSFFLFMHAQIVYWNIIHSISSSLLCGFFFLHRLAQTGEGIQECELVRWFVQEGDPIEEFGKVCEVHSDKATIEITSPYSGTIQKLRHPEGAIVPVGDVLAEIVIGSSEMATLDDDDGALTTENGSKTVLEECLGPATVAPTPDNSLPQRSHPSHSSDILTSPAVRKLALDHDVNLENVTATGPGGRISKGDVLAFLETQNNNEQQQHLAAIPPSPPPPVVSQTGTMASSQSVKGEAVVVPLRGYRKAMFKSMTAVASIPHFHYCDEICTDAVMDLRARLHNSAALKGAKLTFMPFFIKAAAMALAENPMINCSLAPTGDALLQHSSINIGVAVATPLGLVVPNIKNVEQLSIAAIAREMRRLQEAAMNNQLKLDDISGGTFTISNIGVVGGTYATPLINPPEVRLYVVYFYFLGISKVKWILSC